MKIIILISVYCCLVLNTHAGPYRTVSRPYRAEAHKNVDVELDTAASDSQPMMELYTDKFNMFVPVDHDEHEVAASMHFQNFDKFTNSEMVNEMDESVVAPRKTALRAPRPLSYNEKNMRAVKEIADAREERAAQRYLKTGNTEPQQGAGSNRWEVFDYDAYSGYPGQYKRYTQG